MDILVVGSGGREHALAWKLSQSPEVETVYCAPGNGGISLDATCVPIEVGDFPALISFAKEKKIGLTVVGPEVPLCDGIVDAFEAEGLLIFGPNKKAAEIEGSKAFARELCLNHHIPGPHSWTFTNLAQAYGFLQAYNGDRIVVKASGLAAGKGVRICSSLDEARRAVSDMMDTNMYGEAGHKVVFEQFLEGEECSMLAFTDGDTIVPLESAMDHKARFEEDKGPNTGGMGAISPAPAANPRTIKQVESHVLVQTIHGMAQEGRKYRGVLYAGLMVTPLGPRVLEFNARFGDPETQVLMVRMKSDLLPFLIASAKGKLAELGAGPEWDPRPAATVVAVSGGYPGPYEKGKRIEGLESLEGETDLKIFHSGTVRDPEGGLWTSGGRVLSVTALGSNMDQALSRCYAALDKIHFEGMGYRTDIGRRRKK
ncbi:MAG TPA: phosphoribosylamine--glycine ligase [Planctomycetes bacterium]|nr:phosphoribosylamine--glycine ligase [Planctomycetota bacterium]